MDQALRNCFVQIKDVKIQLHKLKDFLFSVVVLVVLRHPTHSAIYKLYLLKRILTKRRQLQMRLLQICQREK